MIFLFVILLHVRLGRKSPTATSTPARGLHSVVATRLCTAGILQFRGQQALTPVEELASAKFYLCDATDFTVMLTGPLGVTGTDRDRYTRWVLPK